MALKDTRDRNDTKDSCDFCAFLWLFPLLPSTLLSEGQMLASIAIFLGSYLVFAIGNFPGMKIDRPGAAIIGAVLMFGFRVVNPADAFLFIDFSTIVLLFSMMLIVGNLHLVGFFEWIAEVAIRRLHPRHLLPTVIIASGVLSAFFVNDIICLVMVPLVLSITRRMRVLPLPFLLATATASNIGSVATITGNPQNMLIGSFSGIGYRDFLFHLGPVAAVGLVLDWAVLHWLYLREPSADTLVDEAIPAPVERPQMRKTAFVMALVVAAFFAGVPPALSSAVGAGTAGALRRGGLGPAGLFHRPVSHCRGRGKSRHHGSSDRIRTPLEPSTHNKLHPHHSRLVQRSKQRSCRHAFEISHSRIC